MTSILFSDKCSSYVCYTITVSQTWCPIYYTMRFDYLLCDRCSCCNPWIVLSCKYAWSCSCVVSISVFLSFGCLRCPFFHRLTLYAFFDLWLCITLLLPRANLTATTYFQRCYILGQLKATLFFIWINLLSTFILYVILMKIHVISMATLAYFKFKFNIDYSTWV